MALASVSLLVWTALVFPVAFLFYNLIRAYLDYRYRARCVSKFPGIPPHWLWGHVRYFPGPNDEGLKILRYMMTMQPRISKVFYGIFRPTVSVFHPDVVKTVLKTSEPKALEMGAYKFVHPWLGDGLLLAKGNKWSRNRRLLTPAFHFDILRPYMKINNQCVEKLLRKMDRWAKRGEYFEVISHISQCTLDIILLCAFSYETDVQERGNQHPYMKAVIEMGEAAVHRMLTPYLYPELIWRMSKWGRDFVKNCNYVHSISNDIIAKRKKVLEKQGISEVARDVQEEDQGSKKGRYLDFLDILLTAKDTDGQGLTHHEIRDEVDTFLFEGHDTTASGISWTLFSLAEHPEHQKRCQQEIDEVLQGRETDEILWDDLPKLKYLTQCIKEAMRLHTPVPFISRHITKDIYLDGFFLPKNTVVDIQLYNLHHNPTVWDEPMEYRPERFDPDKQVEMDNYAFVPFSAGPRNCIGQNFAMHEQKSVIARILRRFWLELDPNHVVGHRIVVVMKSENGIMMRGVPRKPGCG